VATWLSKPRYCLYEEVIRRVAFPTRSNRLKDIGVVRLDDGLGVAHHLHLVVRGEDLDVEDVRQGLGGVNADPPRDSLGLLLGKGVFGVHERARLPEPAPFRGELHGDRDGVGQARLAGLECPKNFRDAARAYAPAEDPVELG